MAGGNVPTPFWRALQREDRQWHGYHWYSGCQKSVALSTCNAEYATLSGAVQEVTWLSQMLAFLGFGSDQPMAVYEDNEAAEASRLFNELLAEIEVVTKNGRRSVLLHVRSKLAGLMMLRGRVPRRAS